MIRTTQLYIATALFGLMSAPAIAGLKEIGDLLKAGQHREALAQLEALPAAERQTPHYLFSRARALQGNGQQQQAVEAYEALIKDHPELPEAYNNLAAIYMERGKAEEALKLLNQAMQGHPGYAQVYHNLTAINTAKARDAYARALQMPVEQRLRALATADRLSLPVPVVVEPAPAPIVTAAAQTQVKPALVYQAPEPEADKNQTPVDKGPATSGPAADAAKGMLLAWAKAWSTKDAEAYIHFYSDDYAPDGLSHADWATQRRQRIEQPKWIQVGLHRFDVTELEAGRLKVRLEQSYQADNYRDMTRKEFILQQYDGAWRIVQERGLGYITR